MKNLLSTKNIIIAVALIGSVWYFLRKKPKVADVAPKEKKASGGGFGGAGGGGFSTLPSGTETGTETEIAPVMQTKPLNVGIGQPIIIPITIPNSPVNTPVTSPITTPGAIPIVAPIGITAPISKPTISDSSPIPSKQPPAPSKPIIQEKKPQTETIITQSKRLGFDGGQYFRIIQQRKKKGFND